MPVSVSLSIKSSGQVPVEVSVGRRFFRKVVKRIDRAQKRRIGFGRKVDGGKIQDNKRSTKARKRRRGQPQISLVDGWRNSTTRWHSAGRSGGMIAGRTTKHRTKVTRWDKAGRSGGMVGRAATVQGKQTKKHHFVGNKAYVQYADEKMCAIWLPVEAEFIARYLRKKGYTGWWGIDAATHAWIDRFYSVTVKAMVDTRAKRRGSGPRLLGGAAA